MNALAESKGYRLVGANRFGFNLIFVRESEGQERLPRVSVESILTHRRVAERLELGKEVLDRPFVEGGSGFPGKPVKVEL